MAKTFYYLRIRLPSPTVGRGAGGEGIMDFIEFLFLRGSRLVKSRLIYSVIAPLSGILDSSLPSPAAEIFNSPNCGRRSLGLLNIP
jgi:hypothetical protein